jgi:hypothetical protein
LAPFGQAEEKTFLILANQKQEFFVGGIGRNEETL